MEASTEEVSEQQATSADLLLPTPIPTIENIVASCSVGCALDVRDVARRAWNVEYSPKRPGVATLRLRVPRATAMVFRTGKIVTFGSKTILHAHVACQKVACLLHALGYDSATFADFKVINVVAVVDFQVGIKLPELQAAHPAATVYETEIFPALIMRLSVGAASEVGFPVVASAAPSPRRPPPPSSSSSSPPAGTTAVVTVFGSGKATVTGVRSLEELEAAVAYVRRVVEPCRMRCSRSTHP